MTPRVAIVGSGLGGFVAYATLRHGGLEPAEIAVFGDDPDPAGAWRPASSGDQAEADALRERRPLLAHLVPGPRGARGGLGGATWPRSILSVCDRYRPSVAAFLRARRRAAGAQPLGRELPPGADRARAERPTVASISTATASSATSCSRRDTPGSPCRPSSQATARVVHAYEPHEYASRVAIVGAGMAAATEWLNALAAGAEVVSVRRREPARRPLNVARPLSPSAASPGSTRLAARRARRAPARATASRPTRPAAAGTSRSSRRRGEGRFRVEQDLNGRAEQVICATGFRRGFEHDPLLARLVAEHELETEDDWIVLADDSTVPALTDATRTLALAGVPAQWAFPAADTLVGMKVAARGFRRRIESCPTR